MKKLLLLFLLFSKTVLLSQTVLNSFPLNLNNLRKTQILNVEDPKTNDICAIAWDNANLNILQYNKSVFLKRQYADSIKLAANRNLMGCTISPEKRPSLYWISPNNKNILVTTYDLDRKTSESLNFDFPKNHQYIITHFQQQNTFYILGKEVDFEHLLLYKFEGGKCVVKILDFSSFAFKNENNVNISFNALIMRFPIQKMESGILNPIDLVSQKSKMYVHDDRLIFTFDNSLVKTQVFEVNLNTGAVNEKTFDLPVPKESFKTTNSFYNDKKLFQIVANRDELLLAIKDFDSGKLVKNYAFSKNDTIPFKNSPFMMQINDRKPQELKTTAKFLNNLSGLPGGISVIKNQKNSFITFSGFGEYSDYYFQFNSPDDFGERNYYSLSKMVYFDALLNEKLDFVSGRQREPLAMDNLFYYLNANKNITLYDALQLQNECILSYYDEAFKQFMMRRFTDGFIMEDNGNPIMNKSQFSKPFSFGSIQAR